MTFNTLCHEIGRLYKALWLEAWVDDCGEKALESSLALALILLFVHGTLFLLERTADTLGIRTWLFGSLYKMSKMSLSFQGKIVDRVCYQ